MKTNPDGSYLDIENNTGMKPTNQKTGADASDPAGQTPFKAPGTASGEIASASAPKPGSSGSAPAPEKEASEHRMKLRREPFDMIKSGKKTIELRLWDEKRRKLKTGDTIVFTDTEENRQLKAKVLRLHRFNSFDELYKSLPLLKCGYTEDNVKAARASDMEAYYSADEQARFGVVGIELMLSEQAGRLSPIAPPRPSPNRSKAREEGAIGEAIACRYLEKNGYTVITRNYRAARCEIDIICEDETHTVFAEVKLRSPKSAAFSRPGRAVTSEKLAHIAAAANIYLKEHPDSKIPRVDVIELVPERFGDFVAVKINHMTSVYSGGGARR